MFNKTQLAATIGICLVTMATAHGQDGNRLAYLDDKSNPYFVGLNFPKLTTPQWVGDPDVDAVVVLAIDDMRDPGHYEAYLRPILDRLQLVQGKDL